MKRQFNIIGIEELILGIEGKGTICADAARLSFDDGYSDHYDYVYPILRKLAIQGCFFLPVKAVAERRLLAVNKIQIILATSDVSDVLQDIKNLVEGDESGRMKSWDYYREKFAKTGRFDEPAVGLVKKLLQNVLPPDIRNRVIGHIWDRRVGIAEREIADEWYMNFNQIQEMRKGGMYFGNHSYNHEWLDSLSYDEMSRDIAKAEEWLSAHLGSRRVKTLCYPYGRFNDLTRQYLNENDYQAGFTTRGEVAKIETASKFELPRLDTNQIGF